MGSLQEIGVPHLGVLVFEGPQSSETPTCQDLDLAFGHDARQNKKTRLRIT